MPFPSYLAVFQEDRKKPRGCGCTVRIKPEIDDSGKHQIPRALQAPREQGAEQMEGTPDSEPFLITEKVGVTFQELLCNFCVRMQILNRATAEQQNEDPEM